MKCCRCQQDNPPQAKFCLECAAPLALRCASCGTQLPSGAKFCFECATPVTAAGPPPRSASPRIYTPRHLAERIINSKAALEGERKQVTVLFADMKGSMELLADRDPEEARTVLDPVLERMMEAVHYYEGTVNQVLGDGIMALFGAPIAHEDHAVRGCYAALRMQRRVDLYADEIQRAGGTPAQIRAGLNSGEVLVRAIDGDLHIDYIAVGPTSHLAARMEQMARPGSVLITGDTLKLAEGYVQVRPLGAVPVKGLDAPTLVYELTGTVPMRSRLQASAARGLTRFVGRDSELQQLAQALEHAAAGHGQAVAVVGEPGVGKSRLVYEFARSHRTHGWLVLESGSVSYGRARPYLPVIDLLKAYCRILESDDPRAIRERVAGKLLMLDRSLEPLLAPLVALLDIPVDDAAWDALDPPKRRQRTLEAVKRLLLRESQVQPLLVIFEDLHGIDAETQALLDSLIESLPTARVLLLVNYRPEYQHAWGHKTYYVQLRIDPLPPASANELLTTLLGEDPTLKPVKRVLIERTDGNPFFLEESVRTLVETEVLVGERGAYRMARTPAAWHIPATAQAVLAARIDRLSPEDKRLLQAASVIGKDVPYALLQAIAEGPEDELRRGLSHLLAAEFLYETSLFPNLEYTFKHALTHEVAYGSVLRERRRALHARIVDAIETLYAERLAEHIERLAHHALQGEIWDKAFRYFENAGARAANRSAYREAVRCFERASEALERLPETTERMVWAIDLRFELRNALLALGQFGQLYDCLREAERLAERLGDELRRGRVSCLISGYFWAMGDQDRARESARRALAIGERLNDRGLQIEMTLRLGQIYHSLGDYPQGLGALRQSLLLLEADPRSRRFGLPFLPAVLARTWEVWCLAERGQFTDAMATAEEASRIAEVEDHPWSRIAGGFGMGLLLVQKGESQRAISVLETALALCELTNIGLWTPRVTATLGAAYAQAGRLAEALPLLESVAGPAAPMTPVANHSLLVSWLGEAYLRVGRLDEARGAALRALDLCRAGRERGHEAWALRLLGEIAMHADPLDGAMAEECYSAALDLASELGMRPLVAHCHFGVGRLYCRTGPGERGRDHLATATTLYRDLDMTSWLEKVGVEMRAVT
jgi:class 3 adenylate cyclase/tetratricopeptide (TPR) repeat protein